MGKPTKVLKILKINPSTYYRKPKLKNKKKRGRKAPGYSFKNDGSKIEDSKVIEKIQEILEDKYQEHYGYIKVTKRLQRQYKIKINKKKSYRLMKEMNALKQKRNKKIRTYSRICANHKINGSNQLWETDIKYVNVAGSNKMAFIFSVIDVFDRNLVGYEITYKASAEAAVKALYKAYLNRGISQDSGLIIRTDNGSQFLSHKFIRLCQQKGIHHERIPVRSPNYNAHIESYHRILKDECVGGEIYMSLEHLVAAVDDFVYGYNNIRIHSSIDYYSPNEFFNLKNSKFKDNLIVSL